MQVRASLLTSALLLCAIRTATPAPAAEDPQKAGTLCIQREACIQWPSESERLRAESSDRTFVFVQKNSRTIVFDIVPSDIASFDPTLARGAAMLRILPRARHHASTPLTLRVHQTAPPRTWSHMLDPGQDTSIRELRLPVGAFTLELLADGYKPVKRTLTTREEDAVHLGNLTMQEAPVITGQVVDRATGEPLATAVILSPDQKTLALPDAMGRFSITLVDEELQAVRVEAPGRAPRIVGLDNMLTASSLGIIELSVAGGALIKVVFPETAPAKVDITIVDTTDPNEHVTIARHTVPPHETEARFEHLEPGEYIVIVKGGTALERVGAKISVEAGSVNEKTVAIRPRPIVVTTLLGTNPLPAATVHITHTTAGWTTELQTDAGGEFVGPIWQDGDLLAAVSTATMPQPHVTIDSVRAAVGKWELAVPDRRIVGRVVDQQTSRPIPNARLALSTRSEAATLNVDATTREDGTFEFMAVRPGRQTLSVTADGYLRPQPLAFMVEPGDQRVERLFQLASGVARRLLVRTSQGAPVVGATVYAVAADNVIASAATDASGIAELPVPADASVTAYAFPREGSFGIARLPRETETAADPVAVMIPPALANLHVMVRDPSGAPIPDVRCVVRYDGEFLPVSLLRLHRLAQPSTDDGSTTLPRLPVGYYELWPYRSPQEALAIIAANGESPLRLGLRVGPGLNRATFELRTKETP